MNRNPFIVEGPALISFSGGRTSRLMTTRVVQAHGGRLPDDVRVVFANTGKERIETLDFVDACAREWGVPVHWLELRQPAALDPTRVAAALRIFREEGIALDVARLQPVEGGFVEVTRASASVNGEPFVGLILERNFLPNPVTRFCTTEMKIRVFKKFALSLGWEHWTSVVGLRADEPRRVARMREQPPERWENAMPLADAGVTLADVEGFSRAAAFDLQLRSWEGNCDLCHLKGIAKKRRIIHDHPSSPRFWIACERLIQELNPSTPEKPRRPTDARFRHMDAPSYAQLAREVARQPFLPVVLDGEQPDDLGDCVCGD